jgi:hypothetical protein
MLCAIVVIHHTSPTKELSDSRAEARLSTEPNRLKNKKQSFSTWDNNDLGTIYVGFVVLGPAP